MPDRYVLLNLLKLYLAEQRKRGEPRSATSKVEAVIALVERDRRE